LTSLPPNQAQKKNAPARVLVVEDNIIIGMDVEAVLERLGVSQTVIAPNVTTALAELDNAPFDYALLDIKLGTETVFPVADTLTQLQTPFAFVSGYGEVRDMPARYAKIRVLTKPYEEADLENALMSAEG
jgi:CheY-like chemotaxis protein